jgi:hypothetical protein
MMRTKRTLIIVTAVVALVAFAAFGNSRGTQSVRAQDTQPPPQAPPQPDNISFGMVGITRGQTVRINVVNTSFAVCPCDRVVLTFLDAEGRLFRNRDGRPIRKEVTLEPGQSTFLDLNADDLQFPPGPTRIQLRAVVNLVSPPQPENGELSPPQPDRTVPSVEVFNNSNGRTVFALSAPPAIRQQTAPQPE